MGEVAMRDLKDKIAVVTGAASGIGQATAVEFAGRGADLVVSDVNEVGLAETVAAIEEKGRRAVALGVDVSKPEQIEGMIDKTIDTFGRIDILMNNAGVGLSGEMRYLSLKGPLIN
jgi:3-oxoacyl-[acyl-carrier protein] reductase